MKLGIYLNSQHRERDDPSRRLAETLEQARLIRTLGFDSIRAGEHHLVPGTISRRADMREPFIRSARRRVEAEMSARRCRSPSRS
jgi:alkanesulfonate monooxygenase SsuD/methylene tetrahydromethanopterin reductase-like flavin-dependent oxidoreductase (luciferase family)